MTEEDKDIVRMKGAGVSTHRIALKLGMTEVQVDERWNAIRAEIADRATSGYASLVDQFTVMAHQYQLLGESLKIVAGALGNVMPDTEVQALFAADPKLTVRQLKQNCIILRPFVPVNPQESIDRTVQGN